MLPRLTSVFATSFILLAIGCSSNSPTSVASIESVLQQDSLTEQGATSIAEVVKRMRAIDLSSCPPDFRSAYVQHIHAWESAAAIEQEYAAFNNRYNSGGALMESFFRGVVFDFGMVGESNEALEKIANHQQQVSSEIRNTFHTVENIAVEHGANLPK